VYRNSVKIALILVYLVIVAGAVVRMTGSGMGCPDWPKCFGYYIPPTQESELLFQAERDYEKGQVIIVDESLKVAKSDFTSAEHYNPKNWENYTRHDYAVFNPAHTWTEYINRLVGALAGFAVLIMAVLSFRKWKTRKRLCILSWLSVFLMVFQAWLGATVVYSVLAPVRITLHMVMALVIVAILLYILADSSAKIYAFKVSKSFKAVVLVSIILSLIQVILGTQVRQFVDEQVKVLGYGTRDLWLNNPEISFYIHRSFSVLIFLVNLFIWWKNKQKFYKLGLTNWIIFLIVIEIFTGMGMYYLNFPFLSQPLHLVIASVLFGVQFYLLLECFKSSKPLKTS
tara:strand:- start:2424 stop:3449 length:1026 start_codon:yes stop_codon:yes gene_type:complete